MIKVTLLALLLSVQAQPGEEILDRAHRLYRMKDYHSALTEVYRYRTLYPGGILTDKSLLLEGKSHYGKDRYGRALEALDRLLVRYPSSESAEEGLYLRSGYRLSAGTPLFGWQDVLRYRRQWPEGKYASLVDLNGVYARALTGDISSARDLLELWKERYPVSPHLNEAGRVEAILVDALNRPRKSMALSVIGSVLIPGFGHFYTGKWGLGTATFLTNGLLIFLTTWGFVKGNLYQGILFGALEAYFYSYSLYMAVKNVDDYNRRGAFREELRLSLTQRFN
jgi:tetratricopeptide (TPR) repeat protein